MRMSSNFRIQRSKAWSADRGNEEETEQGLY
jgi:hypothetical protein